MADKRRQIHQKEIRGIFDKKEGGLQRGKRAFDLVWPFFLIACYLRFSLLLARSAIRMGACGLVWVGVRGVAATCIVRYLLVLAMTHSHDRLSRLHPHVTCVFQID